MCSAMQLMELVTKRLNVLPRRAERHGFQETSSGLRYKDWLAAYNHSFTVISASED